MCDASDYAVGAVLGQRDAKFFHAITMPKRTLDSAFFVLRQRFISAVYFGAVKSIDSA
jgi:hypothetical protein